MENDNYVFCCSGGRTSGMMTIECLSQPEYKDAIISFQNTGKEDPRTLIFVNEINKYLGGDRVVWLEYELNEAGYNIVDFESASRNSEPFAKLIYKKKMLPNRVARFCTQELKIRPLKKFCQGVMEWKNWTNLIGIRYDEPRRWSKGQNTVKNECFDVEHPLIKMRVTKPIVKSYWKAMPFDLPDDFEDHEGNCDVCFLKGKKKKMSIAKKNPEKFKWWIDMEKDYGYQWVNDYTYEQILSLVQTQPELFDQMYDDESFQCFCNVD